MEGTTVTLWVNPQNELYFLQQLKTINHLPIENSYTWKTSDVQISRAMISNWLWINIPIETYIKFSYSWKCNNGKFQ